MTADMCIWRTDVFHGRQKAEGMRYGPKRRLPPHRSGYQLCSLLHGAVRHAGEHQGKPGESEIFVRAQSLAMLPQETNSLHSVPTDTATPTAHTSGP